MSSSWRGYLWGVCLLLVGISSARAQQGELIIIGGGKRPPAVLQRFVREALRYGPGPILVLPMASAAPEEVGKSQAEELRRIGGEAAAGRVQVLNITRSEAFAESTLKRLRSAAGIFISGGSQSRFMDVVQNTPFEKVLRERYRQGAVIAGTSAGAAVQSKMMITGGERFPLDKDHPYSVLRAGNIVFRRGLGLLPDVVIDQHFVARRRFNRLLSLVLEHPDYLGVGIDESTAIWVKPDRTFEVLGEHNIVVVDASHATISKPNPWLEAAGVRLQVLRAGAVYDLAKRQVLRLGGAPVPKE